MTSAHVVVNMQQMKQLSIIMMPSTATAYIGNSHLNLTLPSFSIPPSLHPSIHTYPVHVHVQLQPALGISELYSYLNLTPHSILLKLPLYFPSFPPSLPLAIGYSY